MSNDLQILNNKLDEALARLRRLEETVESGQSERGWQYLVARPHAWRRQLSIKGRNLTVGQLVSTVRANQLTPEQASEDLDLPVEAIQEALSYYSEHRSLIEMEAAEDRRRLDEQGYSLEPKNLPR